LIVAALAAGVAGALPFLALVGCAVPGWVAVDLPAAAGVLTVVGVAATDGVTVAAPGD
jgi:hypothetical protein